MHQRRILAVAALCAVLMAPPAAAQSNVPVAPDQTYVHAASGMSFPPSVGEFRRGRVARYAEDGSDESVGYGRIAPGGEIIVTVYVYPAPQVIDLGSAPDTIVAARLLACSNEFDTVQAQIEQAYRDEQLVTETSADLVQAGANHLGFHATYTLTSPDFMGRRHEPLRSEAYLFCHVGGAWSVKYRISYPAAYDASAEIAAFMQALIWTIGPEATL
ncbi:MAG: hypothetical protein AB7O98_00135 [Hyphomonadaceae bacterium]